MIFLDQARGSNCPAFPVHDLVTESAEGQVFGGLDEASAGASIGLAGRYQSPYSPHASKFFTCGILRAKTP